jgi:hypothetical protein
MIPFILAVAGGYLIGSSVKQYAEGGGIDADKKSIDNIILKSIDGGVFVDTNSMDKANESLYGIWKRGNWSDVFYVITFEDGEKIEGSIDLEPRSFHKPHKYKILTWHINTFWKNVARTNAPYIPEEEKKFAKNIVENYKLYEKGGDIEDLLNNFDVYNLDEYEYMVYNDMINRGITKADALNIIINNTEGDYSELSPALRKIAKRRKRFGHGGTIEEQNNEMLMSNVKEIKHHAEELKEIVTPDTEVDAWVVAKAERSASDLSDITHYLDGRKK